MNIIYEKDNELIIKNDFKINKFIVFFFFFRRKLII
jgi:hypothetical protein